MTRVLSELLQAEEPHFSYLVRKLETSSGNAGVDVRLIADIASRAHQKKRELGLDPMDTTPEELYEVLQSLTARHDSFLAKAIGGTSTYDTADLLPKIRKAAMKLELSKKVWVIKHSVLKKMLKTSPPKKVMKQLGYKSVDSLLKREAVNELMVATHFIESSAWQKRFTTAYKKLSPSDFEFRDIEIVLLEQKKWKDSALAFIKKQHHNLCSVPECGVVAMLPLPVVSMQGITIATLPLLIHYMNDLLAYSAFFKLQQVKPDFGAIIVSALLKEPDLPVTMADYPLRWRTLFRFFSQPSKRVNASFFEPHIQAEDLHTLRPERVLYHLEPALQFWDQGSIVGERNPTSPISFNLFDNAANYCNKLTFSQRISTNLSSNLWQEMLLRYMAEDSYQTKIMRTLDKHMQTPISVGY